MCGLAVTHPKTIPLSTGAAQECVVSPLRLFNHCASTSSTNHIVKFPDDMTVVGLIAKMMKPITGIRHWCVYKNNNHFLTVERTKEIVVDFGRDHSDQVLMVNGALVLL